MINVLIKDFIFSLFVSKASEQCERIFKICFQWSNAVQSWPSTNQMKDVSKSESRRSNVNFLDVSNQDESSFARYFSMAVVEPDSVSNQCKI